MNGKGKKNGIVHSDFEHKKDEASLHYQFFPEDSITRIFLEDHLPSSKKTKNKKSIQRKQRMARRLLQSERTVLRKEWKKWHRQLLKQPLKKPSGLQSTLKNSRFTRTTNSPNKTELNNSQYNSNRPSVHMPVLKRPFGHMSVLEISKFKNDLNNYLKYESNKSCFSNSNIPKANGKVEKNDKLRLPTALKSFISLSANKEEVVKKPSNWLVNNKNDELGYDDEMAETMEKASELIVQSFRLLNTKGSKESLSSGPNIKELSQLIRNLKNFQGTLGNPRKSSSSKSFQNKVVSVHAPPNILHHPSKRLEPQIKACDFPFGKVCSVNTEEDGLPWFKDTIKNSKKILKKCNLIPSVIKETKNSNLTCDSKVWLDIEKLIDGNNNAMDVFVDKVIEKLRKGAGKV